MYVHSMKLKLSKKAAILTGIGSLIDFPAKNLPTASFFQSDALRIRDYFIMTGNDISKAMELVKEEVDQNVKKQQK